MTDNSTLGTRPGEILAEEIEALRQRIAANIIAEGSNASGSTIASMQTQVTYEAGKWNGVLLGRAFFGALETGSQPWRNQYPTPPRFFVDIIEEWRRNKGLDLNSWLVARKIMREGSKLYRDGGRDSIYSKEIPVTLENVQHRLLQFWAVQVTQQIKLNNK